MGRPRRSAIQPAGLKTALPSFAISNSVRDMAGDELKAYARKVGVAERDVQLLSEERLRQNCIVMVNEAMD